MSDQFSGNPDRKLHEAGAKVTQFRRFRPTGQIEWFADLKPSLDNADFVERLLTDGALSVVFGESNSGKTFFALDLALHVAAGLAWQGRRVEQGCVLYFALEAAGSIRNRVVAWRQHHAPDQRVAFGLVPGGLDLVTSDAEALGAIATIRQAAEAAGLPVKLVVVDTLSRAMAGGNENAPEDMGKLVKHVDQIRLATGAHVMLVHHAGKDQARGARGHSLLRAAVDTEIEVTGGEDGHAARVTKQRDLVGGDRFAFALEEVIIGADRRGADVTTCVVEPVNAPEPQAKRRNLTVDQTRALDLLTDLIRQKGELGHEGVPRDCRSVPENDWRTCFFDKAKPAAPYNTKRMAFTRASDALVGRRLVGMGSGRVWLGGAL
jgi:hypothetical protein